MKLRGLLAISAILGLCVCVSAQSDQKPQQVIRISSGIAEGLKIHCPAPRYPREAREKGIHGDVVVQATIDTKGNLINLNALNGDPILVKASLEALKKWKYRPYVLNGEPVMVVTAIKITFHL
jgi:protein TonB